MTNIIIIECGTLPEDYEAQFGDYPSMFERLLDGQCLTLTTNRLVRGDALPEIDDADGFLITGSRHGVYDDLPWIEPLKAFIRAAYAAKTPIVGICFGHQIMAEALGGKVIKSPKGWGLGPQEYQLDHDALPIELADDQLNIQAIHQDQIVEKPNDARVFASSEFCEYAGLVYGQGKPQALSLQPHPEFEADFVGKLVAERRGEVYPAEVADPALAKMDAPLTNRQWGAAIATFFKSAQASPHR